MPADNPSLLRRMAGGVKGFFGFSPKAAPILSPAIVEAQYVLIDVAQFSNYSSEQQLYIVDTLKELVVKVLDDWRVKVANRMFLPMGGDTLAIALIPSPDGAPPRVLTIDLCIEVAKALLQEVHQHNAMIESDSGGCAFHLRIGLNRESDTPVIDINGRPTLVGRGINDAMRIMGIADGDQILLGRRVRDSVSADGRYSMPDLFREYEGGFRDRLPVFQFRDHLPGLNVDPPKVFAAGDVERDLKRLNRTALRDVSEEAKLFAIRALVDSMFSESGEGVVAFIDAVERFSSMTKLWRSGYEIRVRAEPINGDPGYLRVRCEYSWDFENHSGKPVDYPQKVVLYKAHDPKLVSFHVGGLPRNVPLRQSTEREGAQEGETTIHIPPFTPSAEKVRVRYVTEGTLDADEVWTWIARLPVYRLQLWLEYPPEFKVEAFLFGITDNPKHWNPTPLTSSDGPGRAHWLFKGWMLPSFGLAVEWGRRAKAPPGNQTAG